METESRLSVPEEDLLSNDVIGAAIEVHRCLGPGLLESAYEECLCGELADRNICFERQQQLPITYKGRSIECSYRLDIVVEGALILELKAVDRLEPIHVAQMLTYLKLSRKKLGILINFNVPFLRLGIRRVVNNL